MTQSIVYCAGRTPALISARQALTEAGVTIAETPGWETRHLLLDVPSFRPGLWTEEALDTLLASLPRQVTVWGGNLNDSRLEEFKTVDLLQDEDYLVQNAVITAECTIPIAQSMLSAPWEETPTLVIGWGRIGKALAPMLRKLGCPVTVVSGSAAGEDVVDYEKMKELLPRFRLIINTAPAMVLTEADAARCRDCVKIDLASVKGMAGEDVHWARALPGRYAPEKSGKLIADTFLRLVKEADA